ncbi:MAG: tetratricopeptide repeat protein [Candidatus Cryptobacteroides sp.]
MKGFATLILAFGVALCALPFDASAQVDRREVRKGNREFRKGDYKNADIDYRRAVVKDSTSLAAQYNLGNTLYKSGDYAQAASTYEKVKDAASASDYAADWNYNVGNAAASQKNWQAAVDAYKEALLRNPGDLDAKENYIYARKMLQNQQNNQNQDQNNQDDQNKDDQNKDNQDQNKDQNQNQDNDKNQDQNKDNQNRDQNNDNQDRNQDNQQGQQPKITPQAAQQLLQAIQAKEKETQEKVNKEKAEALKSRQKEKNW